ncbi:MAG: hypothetical protein DMD97_22220 [Candidatus Rokuibacteriota bacterium]|nr:MAG: hypothetical protein DMD97_22220 [Candidatus Rokubacteria bacterium]
MLRRSAEREATSSLGHARWRAVALAGDVVEIGHAARHRLPGSSSAGADSLGHTRPCAVWGRYVVGADDSGVVSTRVPSSWDSRYLGPISRSQVRTVARPLRTVD